LEKPGLSILIPYPDPELSVRECLHACVRHYFYPILSEKLIIDVRADGKRYRLDAENLDQILKRTNWKEKQGMLGLADFARWAIQHPEENFVQLEAPGAGRAPKLRDLFSDALAESLYHRFLDTGRMAFSVPVHILRKIDKTPVESTFQVFLERDDTLDRAEDHFIRQGITIPEVTSLKHRGLRAIVSITHRELSTFLGDAENPAHTEWERNSKRFKRKYRLGPSTLDFIKSSPREIAKILTQPRTGRDENLLRHVFSLPIQPIPENGRFEIDTPGSENEKNGSGPPFQIVSSGTLQIQQLSGGFRLARQSQATKIPRYITVWMAYEVRTGNPFKKYSPLDFDIVSPPIQLRLDGARWIHCQNNIIQFEVKQGDFSLTVTGFDIHRDLRIKTIP
jgi:hypothetical protein